MADQRQTNYQQEHEPHQSATRNISGSQVLTIVTLFPLGGLLLLLAGITLTGTIIGLAIATPLFVIFSPVLIPAVLALGLAVTGLFTSGAFGITALSSLLWLVKYLRHGRRYGGGGGGGDVMEMAKRRVQDTAGYVGHGARDVGHKTQEAAART